jgi:hypothetical protein
VGRNASAGAVEKSAGNILIQRVDSHARNRADPIVSG